MPFFLLRRSGRRALTSADTAGTLDSVGRPFVQGAGTVTSQSSDTTQTASSGTGESGGSAVGTSPSPTGGTTSLDNSSAGQGGHTYRL